MDEKTIKELLESNYKKFSHDLKKMYRISMNHIDFECMRCNHCCHIKESKKDETILPLFKEEVNLLKKRKLGYGLEDVSKGRVSWMAAKVKTTDDGYCVYYDKEKGCKCHRYKPLICFMYPFTMFRKKSCLSLDCNWVLKNKDKLEEKEINAYLEQFVSILDYYTYLLTGGMYPKN